MRLPILLCSVAVVGLTTAPAFAAPEFVRWFPATGAPRAVAVAPDGNVLVIETLADRIEEFTPTGVSVRTWGSNGNGPSEFWMPASIVFTAAGNVLVADYGNGRIQEFTRTGSFIREFGNGMLSAPGGIDVDSQGNIFVAEWGGSTGLSKFDASGVRIRRVDYIPGLGSMQYTDVAIGPGDLVYALDGFGRVLRFTNALDYLGSFASFGNDPGQLVQPQGLAFGPQGRLYVGDTGNRRVQSFGADGTWLEAWGTPGFSPPLFYAPTDLDVSPDGFLFVADKFNNAITVWSDAATPAHPTSWGALKSTYRGER